MPCTVKESFAVAGMPHTSGSLSRRGRIADGSATAVERLLDAGAICLGVTNTSELTLWIESENRVWGRTDNAYDPARTAGGSSGGEGASIGSGFAPIGLGTDIGGSIRLPAFFNGVFGHKPSGALVPHTGHYPSPNERGSFLLGCGPLTRRAEDLMPVLRAIAGPDGIDRTVREVELGDPESVSIEGLRVVISDDATLLPVSLELRNARVRAARALREAGAEVVRVSLPAVKTVIQPYLNAMRESGGLRELLTEGGAELPGFGRLLADAIRGRSPYTTPLLMTLASENLAAHMPERLQSTSARRRAGARRAGRRGDRRRRAPAPAVLPRRPAARAHGRAAVDDRADGAVQPARPAGHRGAAGAERGRRAARRPGGGRARPRPRLDRGRGGARARLRRLGAAEPRGGARSSGYSTVTVPSIPRSRWLPMLQYIS